MAIDVGGSLMEVALKHFNEPTFVKDNDPTLSPAEKSSEEKARSLVPKAIPFNPEGQPLAQVEAVPVGKESDKEVDIPWDDWFNDVNGDMGGMQRVVATAAWRMSVHVCVGERVYA